MLACRMRTAAILGSLRILRVHEIPGKMKKNEDDTDGLYGSQLGDRAVRNADSPDHECDCPGQPPQFYLPPPPRPDSLVDSDCWENSTSHLETCEVVPMIDAEYHYSPTIPSLAIILTVALAVVIFLLIVTFLVLLKKRRMQNFFPRKSSPQKRCDAASANGVLYEDLTNVRPRMLSSHCPPGQTTLPSIEMIDVVSFPERATFAPVMVCSSSPVQVSFDSRELFNPVYEELSNGSGECGETDSEEMPPGAASEDEFAEDELSFGGETDTRRREDENPVGEAEPESQDGDVSRDAYSSDSDDKCKFLENSERNSNLASDHRDKVKRTCRGPYFRGVAKKPKVLDGGKIGKTKAPPPLPAPPVDNNEFHEGFLLKRILQIYPDATGMGLQYSCRSPNVTRSEARPLGGDRYESFDAFSPAHHRRPEPEIFSTFGPIRSLAKNQSQDSSLGSDSGYSNNTSGGKSSSRTAKEYGLSNPSENTVLS